MSRRRKILIALVALVALVVAVLGGVAALWLGKRAFQPTDSTVPAGVMNGDMPAIETVATNLETPWDIAFLPDGDMLVTERPGSVKHVIADETYDIDGVTETSEGGLLGIALHPDFAQNKFVYLYSTYQQDGGLQNQVERYVYTGDALEFDKVIINGIPGASNHDGGALAFGPDGKLYITTGDARDESSAQDTEMLSGKILRLNADGTVPDDNPFGNAVYSYGHRNPQGLAWDDRGRMWAVEHGPSGVASGRDELNRIEKGANYGWPVITGGETRDGMRTPVVHSGDTETWAPSGLAFVDGSLYFSGLRGQSLYQAQITGENSVELTRHFSGEYGRLRAAAAHDGRLYISTSNTDGRGSPAPEDDRIIRIDPAVFAK